MKSRFYNIITVFVLIACTPYILTSCFGNVSADTESETPTSRNTDFYTFSYDTVLSPSDITEENETFTVGESTRTETKGVTEEQSSCPTTEGDTAFPLPETTDRTTTTPTTTAPIITTPTTTAFDTIAPVTTAVDTQPSAAELFSMLSPIEKVVFAVDLLYSADEGKMVLNGETVAAGLVDQLTTTEKTFTRCDGKLKSKLSSVSTSSVVNINDKAYGDGMTYHYSTDGGSTYSEYSKSDYISKFGPTPEQFIPYLINGDTVISGTAVESKTQSGEISVYLELIPDKTAADYMNQLRSNAERGGAKFTKINYIKLTFVISPEGVIRTMNVDEQYSMKYSFIPVNCTSSFRYEFNAAINAD